MITENPKQFGKFFILEFTKEIIRSTEAYRKILLQKEVKHTLIEDKKWFPPTNLEKIQKKKEEVKVFVKNRIKNDSDKMQILKAQENLPDFSVFKPRINSTRKKQLVPRLEIPGPLLPETVRHLVPFPSPGEISLDKINVLLKDPLVKTIECVGPDEKIIVTGAMGRKKTSIVLNREDIDFVIQRFSDATKIPVTEGIFRVVFGRLSLSAVVSEVVGSKFILRKMSLPPLQVPFGR